MGEPLPMASWIWNPLRSRSLLLTSTLRMASTTSYAAGKASVGPMSNWVRTPRSSIALGPEGQGDDDHRAELVLGRQRGGLHRGVGVGDAPELLWIAEVARRHVVQPVALDHGVLRDHDHLA